MSISLLNVVGCRPDDIVFEEKTTSTSLSTSVDSETDSGVDETSSTSVATGSMESTTGFVEMECKITRSESECSEGLVCIALNTNEIGKCVLPCIKTCANDMSCEDWTAISQPQLPSGVGVCM